MNKEDNLISEVMKTMRYNLLWYIPLCIWVLSYFILPNIAAGYQGIKTVLSRITWGLFFSPSAYIFFAAIMGSVLVPIQLLIHLPLLFSQDVYQGHEKFYKKKYLFTLLIILAIIISALLIQFIIWGSFPTEFDKQGHGRLRMIPFIPWPGSV